MPCRDYYDDHPEQYFHDITLPGLKKQISFAESALCGALDALSRLSKNTTGLEHINYRECGITREELEIWRKKHKTLDEKHKKEERRKKLQMTALNKLTAEEREALGLK